MADKFGVLIDKDEIAQYMVIMDMSVNYIADGQMGYIADCAF